MDRGHNPWGRKDRSILAMIICAVKHFLSSLLYSRPCANARSIEVGKVLHLISIGI